MAIKTQGFSLSALPRSPNIPDKIGQIDVRAIYDGVKQGLSTFEAVRTAPKSMALADATMDSETALAPLKPRLALAQTEGAEARIPMENALLADKALVSAAQTPIATSGASAVQAAQGQASQQFADFADAYSKAQSNADYALKAHELEQLPVKFPWLTQVPEYKTLLTRIADSTQAARIAAQGEEARTAAVNVAGMRAAKPLTGTPYLLNRMDELRKAAIERPDDESILAAIDETQAALNTVSAQSQKDPTADRQAKVGIAENRNEATVAAAKAKYDAKKQAGQAKATMALESAENQTSKIDSLIDDALGKVGFLTTSYGATLANIAGTDARELRATLDSIKANLGFNELREMRLSSPTGGALGNVTERELNFLQSTIQSLDQYLDGDDLKRRLELVREDVKNSWARVRKAYQMEYGAQQAGGATPAQVVTPEELAGGKKWLSENPNDPRAPAIRAKLGL